MTKHETPQNEYPEPENIDVPLDTHVFYNQIIRELATSLQDIVGLSEAEGFMTLVANRIGNELNQNYKRALNLDSLPRPLLSKVLVDLKRRIEGQFSVEYEDDDVIVFRNTRCPFGENVKGRPSLCMMTTTVFGRIAAESAGYARVRIDRAIARGDGDCRVVVFLSHVPDDDNSGKEFFKVR